MHVYQLLSFSPLERFPRELLFGIVSTLPRQDLFRVRLVSKTLATAAASSLFQTMPVWLGHKSLERFIAISNHSQLSQHVTETVFSPLRFIDYGSADQYLDQIRSSANSGSWEDFQVLTSADHIAAYESYIETQRHLSSQGIDSRILIDGMKRLPQLSSITVDFLNFNIGCLELMNAFGTLEAGLLLTYDCEHLLALIFGAMVASKIAITSFKLDMIRFFRRHAATLIEIRFGWMTLLGDDWSSLLTRLRDVKFLRLKHFILNDCDDNEVDLEVQDYVL